MSDAERRPNLGRIVVDIAKLRDYCLSPAHPHGRHKARVFRSVLGLQVSDAALLREALIDAVRSHSESLIHRKTDHHGDHYMLAFDMSTMVGSGTVRSIWLVPRDEEDVLRFITCYLE